MAKARIKREKDFDNGNVTFTVLESGATLECKISDLPQEIITKLAIHGMNAKVGDSAADPNTDALEQMTSVWEQLKAGEWNVRSGGDGSPRVTQLAEALVRATGQNMETVVSKLGEMSDDQKKDLRKHPDVAAAIEDIKLEKAKAKAKAAKAAAGQGEALSF